MTESTSTLEILRFVFWLNLLLPDLPWLLRFFYAPHTPGLLPVLAGGSFNSQLKLACKSRVRVTVQVKWLPVTQTRSHSGQRSCCWPVAPGPGTDFSVWLCSCSTWHAASKQCCAAEKGILEIQDEVLTADVMAGARGGVGPAPDV
jgi:hypothetical protein